MLQKKLSQIQQREHTSLEKIKEKAEKAKKEAAASIKPAAADTGEEGAQVNSPPGPGSESDDAPVNRTYGVGSRSPLNVETTQFGDRKQKRQFAWLGLKGSGLAVVVVSVRLGLGRSVVFIPVCI